MVRPEPLRESVFGPEVIAKGLMMLLPPRVLPPHPMGRPQLSEVAHVDRRPAAEAKRAMRRERNLRNRA